MKSTTVFLVRHGETEENVACIVQGQQPGTLSAQGWQQIEKLGERLRTTRFDCLYSSDLERAHQTAKAIAKHHSVPLHLREDLRERHFGVFEGRPWGEFDRARDESAKPWHEFRPPQGEAIVDLMQRAVTGMKTIIRGHADQTILVCAHGGYNRALLAYLLKKDPSEFSWIHIKNTSVNIMRLGIDGAGTLELQDMELLNCTAHLDT